MACSVRDIFDIVATRCEISQRVARGLQRILKASQRVVSLNMQLSDWLIPQRDVSIHVSATRYGPYGL